MFWIFSAWLGWIIYIATDSEGGSADQQQGCASSHGEDNIMFGC